MVRLSIVVPVHNDESILNQTLDDLKSYVKAIPFSPCTFFFIENGSNDNSALVLKGLVEGHKNNAQLQIFGESIVEAGIGYAYHTGIELALNSFGAEDHWIMLTASDLPFGSSDLQEFLKALEEGSKGYFFIGSKSNPNSKVDRGFLRWLVGRVFYLLRRITLGMKTGDPQGVFFVKGEVLKKYFAKINSRNFFYTTELTYFAEKNGELIIELPVIYQGERRQSSVRIIKHGCELIKNILELKRRDPI